MLVERVRRIFRDAVDHYCVDVGNGLGNDVRGRDIASEFDGGEGGVQEGGVDCVALHGWGIRKSIDKQVGQQEAVMNQLLSSFDIWGGHKQLPIQEAHVQDLCAKFNF